MHMSVYICDRCKQEIYDDHNVHHIEVDRPMGIMYSKADPPTYCESYDLCPNCYEELKKFLGFE